MSGAWVRRGRLGAGVLLIAATVGTARAEAAQVNVPLIDACSISSEGFGEECVGELPITDYATDVWIQYGSLLRFDIAGALPAGAVIQSATMRVVVSSPEPEDWVTVDAYPVTEFWDGNATFWKRDWDDQWSTGGGDHDAWGLGERGVDPGPMEWDVTDLVRAWESGSRANFGVILKGSGHAEGPDTIGWSDPADAPRVSITYSHSGPQLHVTGDLRTDPIADDGTNLYDLAARASAAGGIEHLRVLIDGVEEARFHPDPACPACELVMDEFSFSPDWVSEGTHTLTVSARSNAGQTVSESWSIEVPREAHYAQELATWRADIEQRVDNIPGVTLTRPMPAPPDHWRHPQDCESTIDAVGDCYDAITDWGADVQDWLTDHLPPHVTPASYPTAPVFDYSPGSGLPRSLARRIRDAFEMARRNVRDPGESVDVAIGFHRPLTPAEVRAAIPSHAVLLEESALTGAWRPETGGWQGSTQVSTPSSLDTSMEDFYETQSELMDSTIQELLDQEPEDADDQEDITAAYGDAVAFKAALDAREGFITGVTVSLPPAHANTVLTSSPASIKAAAPVEGPEVATEGMEALAGMAVDAVFAEEAGGGAARPAARPHHTCAEAGDVGYFPRHIDKPNPVYFAPSRFEGDSRVSLDDENHQKVHRLKFRWLAGRSLSWMCSAANGDRNIEMEAMVYPRGPQWSDSWESRNPRKWTQHNFPPGEIHQDDINRGNLAGDFDKAKWPDFAILAENSRGWRYRKLYSVKFTTNEGNSDEGTVIYSSQPTREAKGWREKGYCTRQGFEYKACMFSTVDVCYAHRELSDPSYHIRVDWRQMLGDSFRLPRNNDVVLNDRSVEGLCDPRPVGSND